MNNQHNHDHHHDHAGGFMNGFLLGAIIGAAVVFFLFTEKGKKLLKTITEEGLEGFSELRDLVEEELDDEDEDEDAYEEDYEEEPVRQLKTLPHSKERTHIEPLRHEEDYRQEQDEAPRPSKVKRFFRGVKK